MDNFFQNVFPFYKNLNLEDKKLLCENTTFKKFEQLQSVHNNTECSGLFIVKKGRLRVYMLSDEGKEITLYRLYEGDMCMLAASCVLQCIEFDVYLDAEIPSECLQIDTLTFQQISDKNLEVKNFLLEMALTRFSDVMWVMQQILFMSMDKRIAIFLLDEMNLNNTDIINITHEQIAKHLGSAREVISRILKRMANDNILELSRKGIIIKDKQKLKKLAY